MLMSFSEFKFYQSFRIPVETADDIRFLVERDDLGDGGNYLEDAKLVDLSITGLGFSTSERLSVGDQMRISMHFKKFNLDLSAVVVRAFSTSIDDDSIVYGVEFDEEEKKDMKRLLEGYINSFSPERLKGCLIQSSLSERYSSASEGFEMFSLLLSLFRDLTAFAEKDNFVETLLEEVTRVFNAQRATLYLINPESNELEARAAIGVDKNILKFDYRQGIAGSVFTTGLSLNLNTDNDKSRFDDSFDKLTGFTTKSVICHPIQNRDDKTIGVLQVINKRNENRFSVEDEKTMKVLSLVFSSIFHNYNPISEVSQIRKFSTPFDREFVFIGKSPVAAQIRSSIIKMKDLDEPLLLHGEHGTGKTLLTKIIHFEGKRGLKPFEIMNCAGGEENNLFNEVFGEDRNSGKAAEIDGGTLLIKNIDKLSSSQQEELASLLRLRMQRVDRLNPPTRFMFTTTQDISDLLEEGQFSSSLHDLLMGCYIYLEPLRRRKNDIQELVNYFLRVECKTRGLLLKSFTPTALKTFDEYDWPGNVMELKTCIERAVLYNPKAHVIADVTNSATPLLDKSRSALKMFDDIPHVSDFHIPLKDRIALIEKKMIEAEIKRNNGNRSKAAKEMGISRETLRKKLHQSSSVLEVLDGGKEESKKAA